MKRIIMGLLSGIVFLTAYKQSTPAPDQPTSTSSPLPTATPTRTALPSATPTASITPLPTIIATLNELVQLNPFPTGTPNYTFQALAQKWNTKISYSHQIATCCMLHLF